MTGSLPGVLVDSNVLVYAYEPATSRKQEVAVSVLDHLHSRGAGVLSVQVLGETYRVLTQKTASRLPASVAEERVRNLATAWHVVHATIAELLAAISASQVHGLAFWDSVIWATARANSIEVILTEDRPSRDVIDGVRYINPFGPGFDLSTLL